MSLPSSGTASGLYFGGNGIPTTNGVFTASLWFYGLYNGTGYRGSFQDRSTGINGMYILSADSNQSLEAYSGTSGGFQYASTPFSMAPYTNQATWHMLTVVGNGTTSTFYVDGVQAGSPLNWVTNLNIGQVGGQVGEGGSRNLAQMIDDVYVYQTAPDGQPGPAALRHVPVRADGHEPAGGHGRLHRRSGATGREWHQPGDRVALGQRRRGDQ